MRHINNEALELICHFEGFSPKIYTCPAGYPTIGYGHVVGANENAKFSSGISEEDAKIILKADVGIAEAAVLRLITAPINDNQFGALVSFTFNLGSGTLQRSTLRKKVNHQQHDAVPAEFMKWVYSGGKKLPGLVKRRAAEAGMYKSKNVTNI